MPGRERSRWPLAFAGGLALVLLALVACSRGEAPVEELRIGLLAPLTNNTVRFTAHRAAQELVDQMNAAGGLTLGGHKVRIRLVTEDTGGQVERTMSATGKLIQQDKVAVIIGPYYSREAIPAGAVAEAAQVLMLTPAATNPEVTRGRKFVFRVCGLDNDHGRVLARFAAVDLGLKRMAALYDEADPYSSGLAGYFKDGLAGYPGVETLLVPYAPKTEDFKAQLQRIQAFHAQVLLLPNFPEDLPRQIAQARAAGFHGQFLGGDSWDTDRGFQTLPEAQGACFSVEYAGEGLGPELRQKAESLTAKAGVDLTKNVALTLDALELIFAAARAVGSTDPVSLRTGLISLRGFNGLTGGISFEKGGGDPERTLKIMKISGGRLVELKALSPER